MSADRIALILCLGVATYMATREPEFLRPHEDAHVQGAGEVAAATPRPDPAPPQPSVVSALPPLSAPVSGGIAPVLAAPPVMAMPPVQAAPVYAPPPQEVADEAGAQSALAAQASQAATIRELRLQVATLTAEVDRLKTWRRDQDRADKRAARAPAPYANAAPGADRAALVSLAKLTENLMRRIEKLEK